MSRLVAVFLGLVAALGLSATGLAVAGGWAIVKLDGLPSDVTTGKSVSVGFTVLQHGVSPLPGLDPIVRAGHATSGEKVEVVASGQGERGHYVADLTFPSSGTWNWSINAFGADHAMPPLEVLPAATAQFVEANGGGTNAIDGANVTSGSLAGAVSIDQLASNDKSADTGETSAIDESASTGEPARIDDPAGVAESSTVAVGTPVQRRLALGLGAAGLALLAAGFLGALVMRRAPIPARG